MNGILLMLICNVIVYRDVVFCLLDDFCCVFFFCLRVALW